jgi:hypothetical protein
LQDVLAARIGKETKKETCTAASYTAGVEEAPECSGWRITPSRQAAESRGSQHA